jgi:hypothetical protein
MIKIRLTRKQYMELLQCYAYFKDVFNVRTPHHLLLHGHMLQLHLVIYRAMQRPEQKKFNLVLNPCESLAFMQLWQMIDTSMFPLGTVVICECVQAIDKAVHQAKVYEHDY